MSFETAFGADIAEFEQQAEELFRRIHAQSRWMTDHFDELSTYQQVVGMGETVLKSLFEWVQAPGKCSWWCIWVAQDITNEMGNPIGIARDDWDYYGAVDRTLNWARANNYLTQDISRS